MLLREDLDAIYKPISDIVIKKNHDYGDSVTQGLDKFGDVYITSRLYDKLNRLITLTGANTKAQVKDESTLDTVRDIIGYCLLYLVWRKKGKSKNGSTDNI